MKVTLDTNIIASGLFFKGVPADIVNAWLDDRFTAVVNEAIFAEYQRVLNSLAKQYKFNGINELLDTFSLKMLWVETTVLKNQVCVDQDDDKFLACAIAAGCKTIVTGFQDIAVITAKTFFDGYLAVNGI